MSHALYSNMPTPALLAADITAAATSVTLQAGGASMLPTITGSNYIYATLFHDKQKYSGQTEIVKITAVVGETLTVVRAQQSTTAQAYYYGDNLEIRVTSAGMQEFAITSELDDTYVTDVALAANGGSSLVGYIPSGTGAVARTLQAYNREVVHATDFGAAGDGIVDDTAFLQLACNAVNNTGKILLLQKHKVTTPITAPSNAIIEGGEIVCVPTGTTYPISHAFLVQSTTGTIFRNIKFTGTGDVSGSIYGGGIYVDYPYTNGTPVTGTEELTIHGCVFDRLPGHALTGQCIGGRGWNISNNHFIIEGGAATVQTAGGASAQGIMSGCDFVYSEDLVGTRAFIDGLTFANNTFQIDATTQTCHGIFYKLQGIKNAVVTGNTVTVIGNSGVTDHSSAMTHLMLHKSEVSGNTFGGGITNVPSLYLLGCQDTDVTSCKINGHIWVISTYFRNANTTTYHTINLRVSELSGALRQIGGAFALYSPAVQLGDSTNSAYTLTDVRIAHYDGSINNIMGSASSGVVIMDSRIRAVVNQGNTTYARYSLMDCRIDTVTLNTSYTPSSTVSVRFENADVTNCTIYGSASATGGDYLVQNQNSTLRGNRYYAPTGNGYTGYIQQMPNSGTQIVAGDEAVTEEDLTNCYGVATKLYTVYTTGSYQKRTIDTAAPLGSKWIRGDFVWNSQPSGAGYLGYSCATSGYAIKEAWTSGNAYIIGDWVSNAGNIYRATTAGSAGATAPTHTSDTASDGAVTWLFIATSATAVFKAAGLIAA